MDELLRLLSNVEEEGDHWKATCPAHEDTRPSLKISQGRGCIVIHCWAGCRPLHVLQALGLGWDALYPKGSKPPPKTEERRISEAVVESLRRQSVSDWEEISKDPMKPVQGEHYLRHWTKKALYSLRAVYANSQAVVVEWRGVLMEFPRKELRRGS